MQTIVQCLFPALQTHQSRRANTLQLLLFGDLEIISSTFAVCSRGLLNPFTRCCSQIHLAAEMNGRATISWLCSLTATTVTNFMGLIRISSPLSFGPFFLFILISPNLIINALRKDIYTNMFFFLKQEKYAVCKQKKEARQVLRFRQLAGMI